MKFNSKQIDDILLKIHFKVVKEKCQLNTNIKEHLDSLNAVEFAMNIEKEFKISIPDSYLFEFFGKETVTILHIKDFLKNKYNIYNIKYDRKQKLKNILK
jgi:acyl carrier protein